MTAFLAWPAALALSAAPSSFAHEYRELKLPEGDTLRYAIVTPAEIEPGRSYPVLLALPPGRQDESMVEAGLARYWGEQAARRGWIVVSPIVPDGTSFYQGGEIAIPPLIEHVMATYDVEGGRLHLVGASNGGRSAFRAAGLNPGRFQSMTVLPGFPPTPEDEMRLEQLAGMPVAMFVGGDDTRWIEPMERARARLEDLGIDVALTVLPGEGHVPPSLDGEVMMDHLERMRQIARINVALDDFHDAAAKADGPRYFGHMTDDAVFIGTDPDERWPVAKFRRFAEPYFDRGTAWTYVRTRRHVRLAPGADVAWFDELLDNAKYGVCRGTGVLERGDGEWRIAQYCLTIPIPNDVAGDVVEMIQSGQPADVHH